MKGPETYLATIGVRPSCAIRTDQKAVMDTAHRAFLNHEIFFFSSPALRKLFLGDPLRWCGVLTDPVSGLRFQPDTTAPKTVRGSDLLLQLGRDPATFRPILDVPDAKRVMPAPAATPSAAPPSAAPEPRRPPPRRPSPANKFSNGGRCPAFAWFAAIQSALPLTAAIIHDLGLDRAPAPSREGDLDLVARGSASSGASEKAQHQVGDRHRSPSLTMMSPRPRAPGLSAGDPGTTLEAHAAPS